MNQAEIIKFIHSLGEVTEDRDTRTGLILFKVSSNSLICAIIHDGSSPLRMEAKCDPRLAKVLRDNYETVLPSKNMDGQTWNEIIISGQLDDQQIKDLLKLSYDLVSAAS